MVDKHCAVSHYFRHC